jgi:hypothetical protein
MSKAFVWLGLAVCLSGACERSCPSSGAGPRLTLAQPRVDVGTFDQDGPIRRSIALSNDGREPLILAGVEASRFCSAHIGTPTLAPGASGQLDVECRSDLFGPLRESLLVHSNDARAPNTTIEIVGTVRPRLTFDTPAINLTMAFGESRAGETRLVGTLASEAHLRLRDPRPESIDVDLLPASAGQPEGLRIRCKGDKTGNHVGHLVVVTGLEQAAEIGLSWACKVVGTLSVTPTTLYFNLKEPGPKVQFVEVASAQPGFKIQSVSIREGPFSAAIEPGAPSRVKVTVAQAGMDPETRGAVGTLVIVSNDRTEPRKEIAIMGMGRVNLR